MRTLNVCILVTTVLALMAIPPMTVAREPKKPEPKLIKVMVYTWALSTGGISVDVNDKQMTGFTRWTKLEDKEAERLRARVKGQYSVFKTSAKLTESETADLVRWVNASGLRDFKPADSDLKPRKPMLDECPPTLVLVWSDKRRVLQLPLHGTVRSDLPEERLRCYRAMDSACNQLFDLCQHYSRKPYVSAVAVHGKEYQAFEKERDRLVE
jgi:hypothetical protein